MSVEIDVEDIDHGAVKLCKMIGLDIEVLATEIYEGQLHRLANCKLANDGVEVDIAVAQLAIGLVLGLLLFVNMLDMRALQDDGYSKQAVEEPESTADKG